MEAVKPKRKKPVSCTAMTLKHLRAEGYLADVVEQRIPHCFITRDLFGIIDILSLSPPDPDGFRNTVGIQVTSGDNHAARREKALAEPRLRAWLEARNLFVIHSWSKRGAAKARKVWTLRTESISLADLSDAAGG